VPSRHEAGISSDILAFGEAAGILDAALEGKRRDRPHARRAHQPGADRIAGGAGLERAAGGGDLPLDRHQGCDQRRHDRPQFRLLVQQALKALSAAGGRGDGPQPEAEQLQEAAQLVQHRAVALDQLLAHLEPSPVEMGGAVLDVHPFEPAGARELPQPFCIVRIALVAPRRQHILGMPRADGHLKEPMDFGAMRANAGGAGWKPPDGGPRVAVLR